MYASYLQSSRSEGVCTILSISTAWFPSVSVFKYSDILPVLLDSAQYFYYTLFFFFTIYHTTHKYSPTQHSNLFPFLTDNSPTDLLPDSS